MDTTIVGLIRGYACRRGFQLFMSCSYRLASRDGKEGPRARAGEPGPWDGWTPGAESASPPRMGIARPGRSLSPGPRARGPRRIRSAASRRSTAGRGRIRRLAASAPPSSEGPIGPRETAARRRRKSRRRNRGGFGFGGSGFANPGIGGLPEAPLPQGRPVRQRRHRARQRDPEEGARLSAGDRRPRPAPPRARPMRPAAQRGGDAFGAGLHGPRGVRERGIVPVENA